MQSTGTRCLLAGQHQFRVGDARGEQNQFHLGRQRR